MLWGRLTSSEARARVSPLLALPEFDEVARLTNCVPRELAELFSVRKPETYVSARRAAMGASLRQMASGIPVTDSAFQCMVLTLDELFRTSTMAMGVQNYSFLDLGFVYRDGDAHSSIGVPVCRPATLALLDLWQPCRRRLQSS